MSDERTLAFHVATSMDKEQCLRYSVSKRDFHSGASALTSTHHPRQPKLWPPPPGYPQHHHHHHLGNSPDNDQLRQPTHTNPTNLTTTTPPPQRWHDAPPLWVKSQDLPRPTDIPRCGCGAERRFEFQIMPQLLHYLNVDNGAKGTTAAAATAADARVAMGECTLDWGVLAVYTCTASCCDGGVSTGAGLECRPCEGAASAADAGAGAGAAVGDEAGVAPGASQSEVAQQGESYLREFVWRQSPI